GSPRRFLSSRVRGCVPVSNMGPACSGSGGPVSHFRPPSPTAHHNYTRVRPTCKVLSVVRRPLSVGLLGSLQPFPHFPTDNGPRTTDELVKIARTAILSVFGKRGLLRRDHSWACNVTSAARSR